MRHLSTVTFHAFARALPLVASMACAQPIPLHYDNALIEKGFPSPIVRVTIRGQPPARFLVDTGASVHALAPWFIEAAHIEAKDRRRP